MSSYHHKSGAQEKQCVLKQSKDRRRFKNMVAEDCEGTDRERNQ